MGVGKTRTAHELMIAASANEDRNVIRLFISMSTIHFPWNAQDHYLDTMAKTLVHALDKSRTSDWDRISWKFVAAQARKDLGERPLVLLNMDEAQHNSEGVLELKRAILQACVYTMVEDAGLTVIPVLSGVFNVGKNPVKPSDFVNHNFHLKALKDEPLAGLKRAFYSSLGIPENKFNELTNLCRLFDMCGGFPHMVERLDSVLKDSFPHVLKDQCLPKETAQVIFKDVMDQIRRAYGEHRWHSFLAGKDVEGDNSSVRKRVSYESASKLIVRHLLLDIVTERKIKPGDLIIAPIKDKRPNPAHKYFRSSMIKYDELEQTGVVDVIDDVVTAPLMTTMVMDGMVGLFPREARVHEPFNQDWEVLERLAMVSLYVHVVAALSKRDGPIKLSTMRTDAEWIGRDDVRVTQHSKTLQFVNWESFIANASRQVPIQRSGGAKEDFNDPLIAMTVKDEVAIDGVMYLPNDKVLLMSQSKARGYSKDAAKPGKLADTKLDNWTVEKCIGEMRAQKDKLVDAYPRLGKATVVYEVFSNRLAPASSGTIQIGNLTSRERVIVVRGESFGRALGPSFADLYQAMLPSSKRVRQEDAIPDEL